MTHTVHSGLTFAVVAPDGSLRVVTTGPTFHERLTGLQAAVGGYLEMAALAPNLVAYFDEDGSRKNLPRNMVGTLMLTALARRPINFGPADAILGPVVFVGAHMTDEVSLTPEQLLMIHDLHEGINPS